MARLLQFVSDALGLIDFSNYEAAQLAGIVALVMILFEGGLAAGFPEIRPVLRPGISLAVVVWRVSA